MTLQRKLAVLFLALVLLQGAHAQDAYPVKGVRLVAAAAPGGKLELVVELARQVWS